MKIHQTLALFIITISLQAQTLTFGPTTTLFNLDGGHWVLSQPMIPTVSSVGKHVDFYGLTGSTYKKHTYTAGSYPATSFLLYGDFNYITDVHDYDGDTKDDILTDYDIFKCSGNLVYERYPFGNINYVVEGSLDFDGDGLRDVVISEKDFFSGLSILYIFRNTGSFNFDKIIIEQNKRSISTIITADMDGDGRDDIITTNNSELFPFTVIYSNADGTFTSRDIKGNGKYFLTHTLSVTDMDKDGDLDLVAMDYEKGLWFFENQDNFITTIRLKDPSFDPVINGLLVHCDDLNGDGWPEMIVGTLTASKLTILVSKGTGPFEFDALREIGFVQGGTSEFSPRGRAITRMLHTIDINADNKKDIVLTSTFDRKQVAWINNSIISSSRDELLSEVSVYPNPVADFLFFKSDNSLFYTITSLTSTVVSHGVVQPEEALDVRSLPAGMYIIFLCDNNGTKKTLKFIKE
ncbi:MAG: T9SS type A sorting domain-containing protein [Saprospiraceae bacterium]|nr:T9SS type A sorting domain-containing protein [Saprospiraceae bacterium]